MRPSIVRSPAPSKRQNVLPVTSMLVAFWAVQAPGQTPVNVREIVLQSLEAGSRNALRQREYSSTKHVDEKQLDPDGSVRTQTLKTFEPAIVDGFILRKLVAKDGRPLPDFEAHKEDERIRRLVGARKRETPGEKAARLAEEQRKRDKQYGFNREIFEAFNFELAREEDVDGRKNWLIEATPVAGYKPQEMRGQFFRHIKGKIWIDERDHVWTKAEAVAIEPISFGFGIIAKLDTGAHLSFQQTREPDGVWLVRSTAIRAIAHIAIVKRIAVEQVSRYDNFRKVPPGVIVVDDPAN